MRSIPFRNIFKIDLRVFALGCVSSSEDSGANNSRDGSENGELQCQDISLVREELEKLQVRQNHSLFYIDKNLFSL